MRLVYRIQHTAGRDSLARVTGRVPPAVEVITDEEGHDPNPLRCYLRCLAGPYKRATHICVLQDDALPCLNFDKRLGAAIHERPDDILSLFVGGLPGHTLKNYRKAQSLGQSWCLLPPTVKIVHVVALVWPVAAARDFLAWYPLAYDKIPSARPHRSDDAIVGYWIRNGRPRRQVWATVPCLVEHPDDVPQVARNRQRASDAGRRAIAFVE